MVGIVAVPHEQPGEERVDLIDADDRVVGVATRAEMRAGRLLHRAVSIAVLSSDGRLLVHRRADHKDIWPGRWDLAAGGVVAAGEDYDVSARRELAEELGVEVGVSTGEPVVLGDGMYRDDDVALRCRCYAVWCDGPFRFADGEVTDARWVTLAELDALIAEHRVEGAAPLFVPDSLAVAWPLVRPLLADGRRLQ